MTGIPTVKVDTAATIETINSKERRRTPMCSRKNLRRACKRRPGSGGPRAARPELRLVISRTWFIMAMNNRMGAIRSSTASRSSRAASQPIRIPIHSIKRIPNSRLVKDTEIKRTTRDIARTITRIPVVTLRARRRSRTSTRATSLTTEVTINK